jgi:nitroreductase
MIKKLIIYLKALKILLMTKSIKKAKFKIYVQDMEVFKYDNDMLIAQLGYFGHHVEKALKHQNRGNRGRHKRDKLELLVKEAQKRDLQEPKVIDWAKNIILYFDTSQEMYIKKIENIRPHPQKDEIVNFIKQRTTTRFWQAKEIDDNIIQDILETAMSSALSCNRQTIRFSVVKNKIKNMILGDSNNNSMFNKAPVTIYIADDNRFFPEIHANALDVGGVCSLIQLTASAYGISGSWIYHGESYDQNNLKKKLGFKKYMYIYSSITLGYPLDKQEKPPRCEINRFIV